MRILKYLFLILILLFIGSFVFVTTQKAEYNVSRFLVIKSQKTTVYNFINDFRNWETFYLPLSKNENLKFKYPELTSGIGSSFSWDGENKGSVKTTFVKENDSISQKIISDDIVSKVMWKFKDTIGGTKVTLQSQGTLDFKSKVLAFFNGGINSVVGDEYEKSLTNLNKILVYEINTYSIKINGIVAKPGGFYLKQSLLCREKSVIKNIKIVIPRMKNFCKKNNIIMNGKPFVIYDKYDRVNDVVGISMCIPVRDSIFISQGSDMQSGKLNSFTSIKTTLSGDYSHAQMAWSNTYNYISKNNLERNKSQKIIEVYTKTFEEIKNPSKWITEIYIPVYLIPLANKISSQKKSDSTSVKSPVVNIPVAKP